MTRWPHDFKSAVHEEDARVGYKSLMRCYCTRSKVLCTLRDIDSLVDA